MIWLKYRQHDCSRGQWAQGEAAMIELLTPDEMAECDRLAIAGGIAGITLMEKAGRAVADAVARHPLGTRVLVVAGPGNNGGDGFVAARVLADARLSGAADAARPLEALKGDARRGGARAGPVRSSRPRAEGVAGAGVIVDALFGAGLNRAVTGEARALIEAMNASGAPIVAVDLPSGINGASGAVMGAAVRAAESVTFFRRKRGQCCCRAGCMPARCARRHRHSGRACSTRVRPRVFANGPALWAAFPVPRLDGHKYARGHAVVVSGGLAFDRRGAARRARRAAGRRGAGHAREPARGARRQRRREPRRDGARGRRRGRARRAARRPPAQRGRARARARRRGGARATWSRAALGGERAVVLDADALTSFADAPDALFAAIAGRAGGADAAPGRVRATVQMSIVKSLTKSKLNASAAAKASARSCC